LSGDVLRFGVEREITKDAGTDTVSALNIDDLHLVSPAGLDVSVHRHQRLVQPQIRTVKTVLQIISPNARSIAKQHRSIIDRDRIVDCASLEAQLRLASNASGEQFVELRLCLRSADRFLSRSRPSQNQRKRKQQ